MKKLLSLILITSLIIISPISLLHINAADQQSIIIMQINNPTMNVNGEPTAIDEDIGTTPIIKDGRTLVPIRAIIEAMGGTVIWNESTSNVTLFYNGSIIELKIDSFTAKLNEEEVTLDVAATIINGRTMIPIRFVAENFGCEVEWNKFDSTIRITYSTVSKIEKNKIVGVWKWITNDNDLEDNIWVLRNDSKVEVYYTGDDAPNEEFACTYMYNNTSNVLSINEGDSEFDLPIIWNGTDMFSLDTSIYPDSDICYAVRITKNEIPKTAIRLDVWD